MVDNTINYNARQIAYYIDFRTAVLISFHATDGLDKASSHNER